MIKVQSLLNIAQKARWIFPFSESHQSGIFKLLFDWNQTFFLNNRSQNQRLKWFIVPIKSTFWWCMKDWFWGFHYFHKGRLRLGRKSTFLDIHKDILLGVFASSDRQFHCRVFLQAHNNRSTGSLKFAILDYLCFIDFEIENFTIIEMNCWLLPNTNLMRE